MKRGIVFRQTRKFPNRHTRKYVFRFDFPAGTESGIGRLPKKRLNLLFLPFSEDGCHLDWMWRQGVKNGDLLTQEQRSYSEIRRNRWCTPKRARPVSRKPENRGKRAPIRCCRPRRRKVLRTLLCRRLAAACRDLFQPLEFCIKWKVLSCSLAWY